MDCIGIRGTAYLFIQLYKVKQIDNAFLLRAASSRIAMEDNPGKISHRIALFLALLAVIGCVRSTPAVMIYFADHNMIFHLVGSESVNDVTFSDVKEKPVFDPVLGALVVSGEGELRFLELVIQFNPKSITVNGKSVDLSKDISANRVVYADGTIFEGDINMPY